ncbi:hypothetical protein [Bradyrhizobium archetypum]|uniref:Uncharacterized protein n=1 Tax=Bradyrhizobium archetypum TaxID=2721160 RepID=A0A7Y4M1H0_9BRAD|nr:hypothetical protein [Bradyrhizobium archetypum]NOJ46379.1 hypothetical protein [Bradyrhizobium archetypum]
MGFVEFVVGPAVRRTPWLYPSYGLSRINPTVELECCQARCDEGGVVCFGSEDDLIDQTEQGFQRIFSPIVFSPGAFSPRGDRRSAAVDNG